MAPLAPPPGSAAGIQGGGDKGVGIPPPRPVKSSHKKDGY